jgi:2-phosphosulfolactate phosphatase
LCAEWIKNELENKPNNFTQMVETIRTGDGARFFDPKKQSWSPQADFELCLYLNRFNFVLKVEQDNGLNYLKKILVS